MAVVLQYHQSAGAKWFDTPTCVAIRNFTEQSPHVLSLISTSVGSDDVIVVNLVENQQTG